MKIIKWAIFSIGATFFIWFLIPVVSHGILNIGNSTGILISLVIIIYGLFMSKINSLIDNAWKSSTGKIVLSVVSIIVIGCMLLGIVTSFVMIKAWSKKVEDKSTLVVLGCGIYGERASLMLVERLDAAYEYLTENPDVKCVLSGGQGEGEDISEALCMYRYLSEKGIDKRRLYMEDKSTSTRENIMFSNEIIMNNNLERIIVIVTNEFHEYRAGKIAEKQGITYGAVSADTAWWLFPTYFVREMYGILYEWFL